MSADSLSLIGVRRCWMKHRKIHSTGVRILVTDEIVCHKKDCACDSAQHKNGLPVPTVKKNPLERFFYTQIGRKKWVFPPS